MIVFIIDPVFHMHFFVVIAVIEFAILHPVFELLFSGSFQYFSKMCIRDSIGYWRRCTYSGKRDESC